MRNAYLEKIGKSFKHLKESHIITIDLIFWSVDHPSFQNTFNPYNNPAEK